jgi:hypothetical protein
MAAPLIAGLPPDLDIAAGYSIRFAALDAATGNAITGVVVSDVSIFGTNVTGVALGSDVLPLLVNEV